jgi:hypothetical protein
VLTILAVLPQPTLGQGAITVTRQDVTYKFSQEIVFELQVSSSSDVQDVVLFYEEGHGEAVNRRAPEFTPGRQVTARVTERLQRGEIPPGTDIQYHWQISDVAGNVLTTEPRSFLYMDDRFQFDSLTEGQVTVYWYGADRDSGQRVVDSAVKALTRLEQSVGVKLKDPIRLIVYQTKDDMLAALPSRGAVFDDRITTLGVVVAPDTVLLLGQQPDLNATIAHELTHVVVGLATHNPYGDLPGWLNEGLAMWNENEGELRGANKAALDEAIHHNRLHTVRSLTAATGNPAEVNLWYGEVFSVVDYLLKEYGRDKMAELLAVFKKGTTYDDALMQVYGFDQDELDTRWRQSLGLPPRATPATGQPPAQPAAPGQATPAPAAPALPGRPVPAETIWLVVLAGVCCGLLVFLVATAAIVLLAVRSRLSA